MAMVNDSLYSYYITNYYACVYLTIHLISNILQIEFIYEINLLEDLLCYCARLFGRESFHVDDKYNHL